MVNDFFELPVHELKGVGPKRASLLKRLKITTVSDLLLHLPVRYEDRGGIKKISEIMPGSLSAIKGRVVCKNLFKTPRKRMSIFELSVSDGSGTLVSRWFNQPFLKDRFFPGQEVFISGIPKINIYKKTVEFENPVYETASPEPAHTGGIIPVYGTTEGLSSKQLRGIIQNFVRAGVDSIEDPVPGDILKRCGLPGLAESLAGCHLPNGDSDVDVLNGMDNPFRRRLAFDELFLLELGLAALSGENSKEEGLSMNPEGMLLKRLLNMLPFSLTSSQLKAFEEIKTDMAHPHPMHRLLQGDVGSGKTIVAFMAALIAVECGYQAAIMAPTELLAEQHYITLHKTAEALGTGICLLTGSTKERPLKDIASGRINIIIGTHALIQDALDFKALGLIVIDEQHRFGVMQRAGLRRKSSLNPDVLIMTATPIPRTLAMTAYGDLSCSVIKELPRGRTPVETFLYMEGQKQKAYEAMERELAAGGQVYVVYPVIEGSEEGSLKSAINGRESIEKKFPGKKVSLLHGRMNAEERERVMSSFKAGDADILVSTTVIEVGVDVPNASLMVIVHAERFGLCQLHQLRGRVGRGERKSRCILLAYDPIGDEAGRRLEVMVSTGDGFKIAEEDLRLRGPGEFLGIRQSGMPELKAADLIRDSVLLDTARHEAFKLMGKDPELKGHPALRGNLERFWRGKREIFKTG
jgi:ATP-dependent DNA helicase RecG